MKDDAHYPHLKDSGGINFYQQSSCGGKQTSLESLFFSNGSSRKSIISFDAFVLLEQLASLCSDEWSMLKKSSCILYKEIELTKSYTDELNVDQQSYEFFTRTTQASESQCDRSNLSASSQC